MNKIKAYLSSLKTKFTLAISTIFAIIIELAENLISGVKNLNLKKSFAYVAEEIKQFLKSSVESIKNIKNIKNVRISNYSRKQRYVAVFLSICIMVILSNDFTALSQNFVERPCKVIIIDGVETIKVPSDMNVDIKNILTDYLSKEEGRSALITSKIEVKDSVGYGNEINNDEEIISNILPQIDYKVLAVDLRLDDEHVAYVNSIEDTSDILEEIKKPFEDPKYSLVDFKEEVTFDETFVSKDEIKTDAQVKKMLQSNKSETLKHTIVEGDTMWDLSIANEVTVDDLLYNNPGLTENSLLQIGDELIVKTAVPMISVRSYERVSYTAPEPFSVETVKNDNEYVDYKKVVSEGKNGEKLVTADVVRTNGVESDRLIIEEKITTPPVNQVIEVGTMNTPPKKAVGTFIMPASGRISDRFGTRGGKHKGIDIANASGTPIYASDGGYVEFVGWQSGYGNLVIINHQNGYKTYYGHNSANIVKQGEMVAQGQQIAKMGTTGRSTGNHSHFEVRVDGTPQNPFNYVKY